MEEVFELNESLDELREAKSAGANLDALAAKLRAAEKNFGEKLHEVDAEMKTAAQQWDAALDRQRQRIRSRSDFAALERIAQPPLLHSQPGCRRGKRITGSELLMGRIVGIDLGTTNSLVAYVDAQTGQPKCIPGPYGSTLVPFRR